MSGNIDLWKLYVQKERRIWHHRIAQTVRGWLCRRKFTHVCSVVLPCGPVIVFLWSCAFTLVPRDEAFSQMSAPNFPVRSTLNTSNLLRGPEARPLTAGLSSKPLTQVAARSPRLRQLNPSSNLIWQSQAWREVGRDLTKMTFLAICSRELSFNREPLPDRHRSFCTLLMRYWFETMHHQILWRLAPW